MVVFIVDLLIPNGEYHSEKTKQKHSSKSGQRKPRTQPAMNLDKKKTSYFPWYPGWLIGILYNGLFSNP